MHMKKEDIDVPADLVVGSAGRTVQRSAEVGAQVLQALCPSLQAVSGSLLQQQLCPVGHERRITAALLLSHTALSMLSYS